MYVLHSKEFGHLPMTYVRLVGLSVITSSKCEKFRFHAPIKDHVYLQRSSRLQRHHNLREGGLLRWSQHLRTTSLQVERKVIREAKLVYMHCYTLYVRLK